jgi:hypothetical protein
VGNLLEAVRPIVAPAGKDLHGLVGKVDLDSVAVELISWIQRDPDGTFAIEDARAGSTNPGRALSRRWAQASYAETALSNSTQLKLPQPDSFRNR